MIAIISGPSGSGKSTMANLRGNRILVDDDCIIVHRYNGHFRMITEISYQDRLKEFPSSAGNINFIFFLQKAKKNYIIPVKDTIAVIKLIQNATLTFWDRSTIDAILKFFTKFVKDIPCYRLSFLPNKTVWDFLAKSFK